jgi:hypothetical protein
MFAGILVAFHFTLSHNTLCFEERKRSFESIPAFPNAVLQTFLGEEKE